MVVGVLTGRGALPLFKVPNNVKVNSNYYVEQVLKPLIEVQLPKLYPGEMNKVFLHHDKCTSHVSKNTTQYLECARLRYQIGNIKKNDIPVKSPDGSQLDFFGFGHLKQQLSRTRVATDGLWKRARELSLDITPELVGRVNHSWKVRSRAIASGDGGHIEQSKNIHNHSQSL